MKAEVKILVEYNHCDDIVFLSSRGVEGDGLPLHIYIGMLQALCQMQKQYNDRQLDITLTLPSEVSIASARDEPTSPPRIEVPPVPKKETPAPPMGFQQKFPTVDAAETWDRQRVADLEEERVAGQFYPPHAENSSADVG